MMSSVVLHMVGDTVWFGDNKGKKQIDEYGPESCWLLTQEKLCNWQQQMVVSAPIPYCAPVHNQEPQQELFI